MSIGLGRSVQASRAKGSRAVNAVGVLGRGGGQPQLELPGQQRGRRRRTRGEE